MTDDPLLEVAEGFGPLLSVGATRLENGGIEELVLAFELGRLKVGVDPDWDTVVLSATPGAEGGRTAVHVGGEPWSRCIGLRVRWIWRLQNQREFFDGVQLEFAGERESPAIQIVAEASALRLFALVPLSVPEISSERS